MARQQTDDPGLISRPSCIKAPGRRSRELRVPENVCSETKYIATQQSPGI